MEALEQESDEIGALVYLSSEEGPQNGLCCNVLPVCGQSCLGLVAFILLIDYAVAVFFKKLLEAIFVLPQASRALQLACFSLREPNLF